MDYIKGSNRDQIVFSSLEIQIETENPVRFVDAPFTTSDDALLYSEFLNCSIN